MGQVRIMPSKKEIALYHKMPVDFCWGCGFETFLDRCHVKARWKGGPDSVDNLILLCRFCHSNIQEWIASSNKPERIFTLLEKHLPFFEIKMNHYLKLHSIGAFKILKP